MTQPSQEISGTPYFQLPKSGLALQGTRLTRRMEKGEVIAEFEVSEITGIEFRARRDVSMVTFGGLIVAAAVALVVFLYLSVWAWTCAALCACLGSALIFGSRQHVVAFTVNRNSLEFPIADSAEDGRAFVLMLQQCQRRPRH